MPVTPFLEKYLEATNTRRSRPHIVFLILAIAIGFLLRFYGVYAGQGYHYFAINDELSAYEYALSLLSGNKEMLYLAQPSFAGGQAPGPVWTIFWALLLKLGGNSVDGAIFWMAVVNTFTIYLVYLIANNFLNPRYALLTTLIYATAPWPIYYSVGVWNPLALALLGGLLFLSLWAVANHDHSRHIFWVCLVAAIIPQFHMVGVFYIPAILLILFLMPTKINRWWFVAGVIAGVAVYVPYLIGEVYHDWENTRNILAKGTNFSFGVAKIISAPATVLSSAPARWMTDGFAELKYFGDSYFGSYIVLVLFSLISFANSIVFLVSFLAMLFRSLKGKWFSLKRAYKDNPVLLYLGILIVMPIVLFSLTGQNYASRYTILIFPLLFLLPAFFIRNRKSIRAKRFWIGNITLIIIFNVYLLISFFSYQNYLIEHSNKFMASFRKLETLRRTLRADAGDDVFIQVRIADDVNALPEAERKTKATVSQYMDIRQRFISHTKDSPKRKIYVLKLVESLRQGGQRVVYEGNGIAIVAIEAEP